MYRSQLDALMDRARHCPRARLLLADIDHMVGVLHDAALRRGALEPLQEPACYRSPASPAPAADADAIGGQKRQRTGGAQ
jgi:hypothetical protein